MTPSTAEGMGRPRRSGTRAPARRLPVMALLGVLAAGLPWLAGCASGTKAAVGGGGGGVGGGGAPLGQALADAQGRIPAPLAEHVQHDRADGSRNAVLHAMRAGKAALDLGALPAARSALDLAYQRIETVYADNPAASKARSSFAPEAGKDFKGEPFERAMVGWYLGLVDLLGGDLDNAAASLRWGEFQDTMSASEQYQGDTAALRFLAGWVDHCRGRRQAARDSFAQARAYRGSVRPPADDDDLLVVLEAGSGPTKQRRGTHGEALGYAPLPALADDAVAQVRVGEGQWPAFLAEDLQFQATTLGGRAVDTILAGKAVFKDNAQAVAATGAGMAVVGTDLMQRGLASNDQRVATLGAYGAAAGLLVHLVGSATASAVRAEADVRAWNNLPRAIWLATGRQAPDSLPGSRLTARAPGPLAGVPLQGVVQRIPGTGCALARLMPAAGQRWQPESASAWVPLDEVARRKPVAAAARSEAAPPAAATAPVRASF